MLDHDFDHGITDFSDSDLNSEDIDDPIIDKEEKNYDAYGCVAYEPALPDSTSSEGQEEKKRILIEDFQEKKTLPLPSRKIDRSYLSDTESHYHP